MAFWRERLLVWLKTFHWKAIRFLSYQFLSFESLKTWKCFSSKKFTGTSSSSDRLSISRYTGTGTMRVRCIPFTRTIGELFMALVEQVDLIFLSLSRYFGRTANRLDEFRSLHPEIYLNNEHRRPVSDDIDFLTKRKPYKERQIDRASLVIASQSFLLIWKILKLFTRLSDL